METNRVYIGDVEAFEVAQIRNIDELPSFNHSVSSICSIKEQIETGIASYNLGKDTNGFFLSTNISYIK